MVALINLSFPMGAIACSRAIRQDVHVLRFCSGGLKAHNSALHLARGRNNTASHHHLGC